MHPSEPQAENFINYISACQMSEPVDQTDYCDNHYNGQSKSNNPSDAPQKHNEPPCLPRYVLPHNGDNKAILNISPKHRKNSQNSL